MQIIIVSDHPEQAAAMRALALEGGPDQVEVFSHPAAALDWCAGHEPDLMLVDYVMRACDGLEFLRRVRALPHLAAVPFILTLPPAPGLGPVRAMALKLGVSDFLTAPADHSEFAARTRNLLLLRGMQQARPGLGRLTAPETPLALARLH